LRVSRTWRDVNYRCGDVAAVGVIARKQKSEPQRLEAAECKGVLLARVKLVPFSIKIRG
jgi:hypothetical protein